MNFPGDSLSAVRLYSFSAVVLAGGRSRRMGQEKAALPIGGRALWLRQVELLKASGAEEVLISGPLDGPWARWNGPILPDDESGLGPLTGLIMALRQARHPLLLVLAVDLPAMNIETLSRLLHHSRSPEPGRAGQGCVPYWQNGAFEPLVAVYPREALALAEQCRERKELALQNFARLAVEEGWLGTLALSERERKLWININTPELWQDFRRQAESC